jgi:hypothetical protein
MAKRQNGGAAVADQEEVMQEQATQVEAQAANFTAVINKHHPNGRTSYVIPGRTGNIVIFDSLFEGGVAPESITLDAQLVAPLVKVDKAAEKAARLQAAADRANAALAAAQAKNKTADQPSA